MFPMSSRTPPGETRERVFRFVRDSLLRGESPTVREVQGEFGFRAVQTAREHLEKLVAEGRLTKRSGRARGYRLPQLFDGETSTTSLSWVPLVGHVHAGDLHVAIETADGVLAFDASGAADDHFALRVEGDSMIDAAILPGDVVIVKQQVTAKSGDIVVALIDGESGEPEATVKRLRRRGRRIELHPENPNYEVIVPEAKSGFRILGRVVEVRRTI